MFFQRWYPLSKTLAERAAWDFTKQHNLDMVVINPGWVFGPVLHDTVSTSNQMLLNVLNGAVSCSYELHFFPHNSFLKYHGTN